MNLDLSGLTSKTLVGMVQNATEGLNTLVAMENSDQIPVGDVMREIAIRLKRLQNLEECDSPLLGDNGKVLKYMELAKEKNDLADKLLGKERDLQSTIQNFQALIKKHESTCETIKKVDTENYDLKEKLKNLHQKIDKISGAAKEISDQSFDILFTLTKSPS